MQRSYASGESEFAGLSVEAAISSVVFEIVERESTPKQSALEALEAHLLHKGHMHNHTLLARVQEVTAADLRTAMALYITPLLTHTTSCVAVVCNSGKADAIFQTLNTSLPTLAMPETLEQAIAL